MGFNRERIKALFGQAVRFGAVGLLNTAVDFMLFTVALKVLLLPELISQVIGYSGGVINSFFCNRAFTFRARHVRSMGAFSLFVLVNLVSLGISLLVLHGLRSTTAIGVYPAKIAATAMSWAINFAGSRWLVFKKAEEGRT